MNKRACGRLQHGGRPVCRGYIALLLHVLRGETAWPFSAPLVALPRHNRVFNTTFIMLSGSMVQATAREQRRARGR